MAHHPSHHFIDGATRGIIKARVIINEDPSPDSSSNQQLLDHARNGLSLSSMPSPSSNLFATSAAVVTNASRIHGTVTVNGHEIASFSVPITSTSSSPSSLSSPSSSSPGSSLSSSSSSSSPSSTWLRIRTALPQDQASDPLHIIVRIRCETGLRTERTEGAVGNQLHQVATSVATDLGHTISAHCRLSASLVWQTNHKIHTAIRRAYRNGRAVTQHTLRNAISKARRYAASRLGAMRAQMAHHAARIKRSRRNTLAAVSAALHHHLDKKKAVRAGSYAAGIAALAIVVAAKLTRASLSMPPWLPPLTLPPPQAVLAAQMGATLRTDIYKWLSFPNVALMTNITHAWAGAPFPPQQLLFTYSSSHSSSHTGHNNNNNISNMLQDEAGSAVAEEGQCPLPTWLELRKHTDSMRRSTSTLSHPDKLAHLGLNPRAQQHLDFIAAAYAWAFDALEHTLNVHEWRIAECDWTMPALPTRERRAGRSGSEEAMDAYTAEASRATLDRELAALLEAKPSAGDILTTPHDHEIAAAEFAASVPLTDRAWAKLVQDWLPCRGSAVWTSPLWEWVGAEDLPARWGKTDVWPFLSPRAYAAASASAFASSSSSPSSPSSSILSLEHCGVVGAINLFPPQLTAFSTPAGTYTQAHDGQPQFQSQFRGANCLPEHRASHTAHLGGDVFFWRDVRRWMGAAVVGIAGRVGAEIVGVPGEVGGLFWRW